jgi:aerobic carbon-monoxide dehydrogenase large subunit
MAQTRRRRRRGADFPSSSASIVSYVGRSEPRREDLQLVTGAGAYVADLAVPGCLDAVFLRSYAAHGHLTGVDTDRAQSIPEVVGVFAATDLPELPAVPNPAQGSVPSAMERPCLARDKVRFVGEPIAIVLATARNAAEDAAELTLAEIEALAAVIDPTRAAEPSSPSLFDGMSNVVETKKIGEPLDSTLAGAPIVVEGRFRNGRIAAASIEARAILVQPEGSGVRVWCSHQAPHRFRAQLAAALQLSPDDVRVIAPNVGGAFGAKSQTYPEYITVAHLALKTGRPVRWIEGRSEAFTGWAHGRGQNQRLRLASDERGRLIALEAMIDADIGAYPHTGAFIPSMTGWVISGAYKIPQIHSVIRSVVTNRAPTASYRGAGRPEAAYALERMMDKLAGRLGIDPAEVRIRNFISPDEFPYSSPTGAVYDSGDYRKALDTALDLARYEEVRAGQTSRASAGQEPLVGVGVATWVERSGGQSGTDEFGSVEVMPDGSVIARSGTSSQGQGHATVLAQIVASALNVELERVTIVQGDTAEVAEGTGTFGSRSVQVGGSALYQAAGEVLDVARGRAAAALEVAEADLSYEAGEFTVVGTANKLALADMAATESLASDTKLSLPQAFPFGAYVAIVEVDSETGSVEVKKLVAVDDCGVVVNPTIARGQIAGSVAQGLGQALYEAIVYDESGQLLTASLVNYSLPTAAEIPPLEYGESVTRNPNAPLGTKGVGESGCIGMPPAILNAIHDALDLPEDVEIEMPATPERVWRALQQRAAVNRSHS